MQQVQIARRTARGAEWTTPESELFAERVVALNGPIDSAVSASVIAQLRYLSRLGDDPITLLVNSPGGFVSDGMAIIDYMCGLRAQVRTHALGLAASMAAVILACGERGYRSAAPHADILIHQPISGVNGQASDIEIAARSIIKKKQMLVEVLSQATKCPLETVEAAIDRDTWFSAEEAASFGLIDSVSNDWCVEEGFADAN